MSEFDEALWGSLVEYVTVGKDKTMVFTMIGGTEITAWSAFERLFGGAFSYVLIAQPEKKLS